MVLDYSKWDNIELSDDSDIEVHPNVDKRSFINAKRRQIHETRAVRKQNITNLRMELSMNEVLLKRLTKLISTLESTSGSRSPEEVVLQALVDISSEEGGEKTPPLPPNTPTYAQMMASLVDSIKREIDQETPGDRIKAFLDKLHEHKVKLTEVYSKSGKRLADLEKEDNAKITSDNLHDGFSAGHVNKTVQFPTATEKKRKSTQKVQVVEQLNPGAKPTDSQSSGADADLEESAEDDNEDHIEPTKLGKEFAKIKIGDYRKCMEYVSRNPAVVAERETDGLLIEAFNSQIDGKDDYAKQITTPNHQAQKVFHEDVTTTYQRIRERAKTMAEERNSETAGVEQIQLHAVDPNTQITIAVPSTGSNDPEIQQSREIFDSFPPGLQRALESGSLDEVNKVLGKMSVEEAEEVVGLLGEGGMLSLESQIIDATTEEGKKKLKQIEEDERQARANHSDSTDSTETDTRGKGKGKAQPSPIEEVD
ncbi:hsp90 co-chaperone Cdc37 [Maublancomyces gigas]|uniref:Hsp90 chaperone protein kinase-targeting subunit n=1 Tax=Discina gigas TaxID=1032678 RepID=A0ABR3GN16_9PEZI